MIIPESEKSESILRNSTDRSPTSIDSPPSPPPYSATVASGDDLYQDEGHSPRSTTFRSTSSPRSDLPPPCNHLIDRKALSSVSGTWHVDTALEIPEPLLPPIAEFDGKWNREAQETRKSRANELRRWQRQPHDSRGLVSPLIETRPNLLLGATNGTINGDIHVVSSDGLARQATLVAEGCNGSISLRVHAPPDQLLRLFVSSTNGSINIKVPSSFEGVVVMSTSWGSVGISDAIKAKITTFSSSSNKSRGFVGDWQAQGFGPRLNPNGDPPLPGARDLFTTWTGPIIDISSTNGAVKLSFIDEDETSPIANNFKNAFQGLMGSWFGMGGQNRGTRNCSPPVPPPPMFNPPVPPIFHRQHPPMFRPLPGAWPGRPKSSPGVGGLDLD